MRLRSRDSQDYQGEQPQPASVSFTLRARTTRSANYPLARQTRRTLAPRTKGKYAAGWDVLRQQRLARQTRNSA